MKKSNLFLMALCILTPFAMFAQYSISGVVKDTLNNPVYGAVVKLANSYNAAYTDYSGSYRISGLSNGTYDVAVTMLGYKEAKAQVVINGADFSKDFTLFTSVTSLQEVAIKGTRVKDNAPVAHVNVSKEDYENVNLGQDIASLIKMTPSIVTTSDAGAGVGYTGFRIRGSDGTRINVTVNGIPINDPESHGTFWVNMPDFASSTENIQIQRGVGSSTNGPGAFGATVNLQTDLVSDSSYATLSSSYGSFNTNKNTVRLGTGLINKHWALDGRLSNITSDGYIDRASADLSSYFVQGGYYGEKTVLKAITFAGQEQTYQSWYGTPEAKLNDDAAGIQASIANSWFGPADSANLVNSGRTYNYYTYDNEVDNYAQDHYQLHFTHKFNPALSVNAALHYTYGRGYFEQFRNQDALADYNLENVIIGGDTVRNTDLIRRRWLDNHFYGGVYSVNYKLKKAEITLGGGYNEFVGDHFGEIIWSEFASNSDIREKFYDNVGKKSDFNTYLKSDFAITKKISGYVDMQVRSINYSNKGTDIDQRDLDVDTSFVFFNPKAGVNYIYNDKVRAYASVAVANREPTRNDFIDNPRGGQPSHETLIDYELGVEYTENKYFGSANFYYMDYQNQLVLTGALNDVGSAIRDNAASSYRAGVELIAGTKIVKNLDFMVNATFSQNKINEFVETIEDYTNGYDVVTNKYENRDISFSPNVILGGMLNYKPIKGLEVGVQSKYVGSQFLDNTSSSERDLDAYFVTDFIAAYNTSFLGIENVQINLLVNNIFNEMYSNNGYTWGFISGDRVSENWLYPQAGTNILTGVTLSF